MDPMSIRHWWTFDVFISFLGEDIRKMFMDHLFNDLERKGIRAFRDDRDMSNGEEIYPHLCKAIEESRFLIVIFSKNYASSPWCLRELLKILECKDMGNPKREVLTIFYDVKPNVVRKQTKSYAEAFAKHQVSNGTEVDKWKEALTKAANLSGSDLEDMTNGYEYKFIDCISKDILRKLCDGPLHVGENLVGMDTHFDKLDLSRFIGSDKVNMIGICGISGIGKTTFAKAIYNFLYVHFKGSCFCEKIKEVGIIKVQKNLINKILETEDLKISSVSQGSAVIRTRLASKPILVVLDGVNHRDQLMAIAGSANWFCPGSLIIFTAEDKQLLISHKVCEIHDMNFLDEDESLELFRSNAFKDKHISADFQEVAEKAVNYVQGHPLALIVLGCFLYGKNVDQWESEMAKLRLHPNKEIQQVLRASYDGLDQQQQNILLDIACVFIGDNSKLVASILDGCNLFADTNMRVLVDKSLITISSNNALQMHDLIQAMAREIVREESSMLGKQRRLLISSEVYAEKKVEITKAAVEVLVLLLEKSSQKFNIDAKDFAHMKKLRILKIYRKGNFGQEFELTSYNVIFSGSLSFLSNELRLFCWHGYPFEYLPSEFYPEYIVTIDLSYSNIKQFWTTPKGLRRLKVMKLRYCCNLTTTPDFSEITNLEELDLEGCVNLVTVHPSIGMLKRLIVLSMRGCIRVRSFPSTVEMESLQFLNLSGCLNVSLWNPQILEVSLEGFRMLKSLNLNYCNLSVVPESIGTLLGLRWLRLKGNNFNRLPGSISQLPLLEFLDVEECENLEVLPEFPPSHCLGVCAGYCTSLKEVSGGRTSFNDFSNCPKLFNSVAIDSEGGSITSHDSLHRLSAFLGYAGLETNSCEFFSLDNDYSDLNIVYHGDSIPEWFTNRSAENHVKVELPSDWCYDEFWGYGVCVVFKRKYPWESVGYSIENSDGYSLDPQDDDGEETCIESYFGREVVGIEDSYMIWLHYRKNRGEWKEAENFVTFDFDDEDVEVKEFGARLICDEDIYQDVDLSTRMLQGLPTPTQHGGMLDVRGDDDYLHWSW